MHGVDGDDTAGQSEFADEALDRRDLVGFVVDLYVAEDQRALDIEGTDQVCRLLVSEMIEAAAQGLAVEGNHPQALDSGTFSQDFTMQAENALNVRGLKSLQDIADGRVGRRTAPSRFASPPEPDPGDLDVRIVPR